jgi:ATP-dependent Zn protease
MLGVGSLIGVSIHDQGGSTDLEAVLDGSATLKDFQDAIAVSLAGRVAEQLILGDISIGSGFGEKSDLSRATEIARSIELRFGLGLLGNVYVGESAIDDFARVPGLIGAVKKRLDEACEQAAEILVNQEQALRTLSDALDRTGYLSGDEVDALMDGCGIPTDSDLLDGINTVPQQAKESGA